jgi:hypothetical protein
LPRSTLIVVTHLIKNGSDIGHLKTKIDDALNVTQDKILPLVEHILRDGQLSGFQALHYSEINLLLIALRVFYSLAPVFRHDQPWKVAGFPKAFSNT